jgi:outer membrane lipoprotein carrier protein
MRVLLILLASLASVTAQAGALDDYQRFVREVTSGSARFEQTVIDRNGQTRQVSTGSLSFARPGKFRWEYRAPYEQVLVGDGKRVWVYDPDLEQVTVRSLGQALNGSPAALLAGQDSERYFSFSEDAPRDGLDWLRATPRNSESGFAQVAMGFRAGKLERLDLQDSFGQTTRLRFLGFKPNPALPATEFRFVAPKGVDVIDEGA